MEEDELSRSVGTNPLIISNMMAHLPHADLLSASGACLLWYELARREMAKRGKTLYRWPDAPPSEASELCIMGCDRVLAVLVRCKGITTLEIGYDEPTEVPLHVIKYVGVINIKLLRLRNVIIDVYSAFVLVSEDIPAVEFYNESRRHLTRKGRQLLLQNSDVFRKLLMTHRTRQGEHRTLFTMKTDGLASIDLGESLTVLRMTDAVYLTEEQVSRLSSLSGLQQLSVSMCNISEEGWERCLRGGFEALTYLSITDAKHIGIRAIKHIAAKPRLRHIQLDLRHLPLVAFMPCLQKSASLKTIVVDCFEGFHENIYVYEGWKRLEKIVIRNHGFEDINIELVNEVKKAYRSKNIKLSFFNSFCAWMEGYRFYMNPFFPNIE